MIVTWYMVAWGLALLVTNYFMWCFMSYRGLTNMFPEGKRWWHLPAAWTAILAFATVVWFHP